MSEIDRIKQTIAESMMARNGWDEQSKSTNPLDWDPNREDSQYRMIAEETDYIVTAFLEELSKVETEEGEDTEYVFGSLDDEEDDEDEEEESIFDEYGHIKREQTITTSASLFIFMDAGTGKPRYVGDVREWLKKVDMLKVPDDTEIEGTLYLDYDIKEPYIERLECGGCGTKDVLLTVHSCEETPC